jgi:hypothetical protein
VVVPKRIPSLRLCISLSVSKGTDPTKEKFPNQRQKNKNYQLKWNPQLQKQKQKNTT